MESRRRLDDPVVVGALMRWPDAAHGVYAISVASELSGVHPQTLRLYEREGLVNPARSEGGTRRYSGEDVERLRLIASLTGAGLNLAGVKKVLTLQAELAELRATIEELEAALARSRGAGR
jgi:MerR family transcriptional regulator/heat shock protein HspR